MSVSESRQPNLYATTITTYCVAVVAVALRFLARRLKKLKWWIDDWCMLVALVFSTGMLFDGLIWIGYGFGKHYQMLDPNTYVLYFFQGLFVGEILYTGILCFVKYSILAFYWRIFSHAKAGSIRLPIWVMASFVTMWGLAVVLVTLLQCKPIRGYWDKSINASCGVDQRKFLYGISIPNILTDVALLVLPTPYIVTLRTSKWQKFALCSVFLLGGFVCIVSIVRFMSVYNVDFVSPDITWNFYNVGVWTLVEANIAIVSGCLPSLRTLYSSVVSTPVKTTLQHNGIVRPKKPVTHWSSRVLNSIVAKTVTDNESTRNITVIEEDNFTADRNGPPSGKIQHETQAVEAFSMERMHSNV